MAVSFKVYNRLNFHSHTFCIWKEVALSEIKDCEINYKSSSGSSYIFSEKGVYRISNHWGRAGNCHWRIDVLGKYKNQKITAGYANWTDFYPTDETSKLYFIIVDFEKKLATFNHKDSKEDRGEAVLKNAVEIAKTIKVIK